MEFPFLSDLFHLTEYLLGSSMLLNMGRSHSFLWLSRSPVCVCVFMYVYFLYSSVHGHLSSFCIVAVVTNAAVNIGGVYVFLS